MKVRKSKRAWFYLRPLQGGSKTGTSDPSREGLKLVPVTPPGRVYKLLASLPPPGKENCDYTPTSGSVHDGGSWCLEGAFEDSSILRANHKQALVLQREGEAGP